MKKYVRYLILTGGLVTGLITVLVGQEMASFPVSATISDENGEPVAGAFIYAEEGAVMAMSNASGQFTIELSETGILLIEATGYATRTMTSVEVMQDQGVVLEALPYQMTESDLVNIPFGQRMKKQIASSVSVLNPGEILAYDARQSVTGVINGRVPGVFGSTDVHGLGTSVVIVDGIPRPAGLLNLQEVEQITVLRDAASRALYGVQSTGPVIMVTTKRGKAHKRTMNVVAETGFGVPISYPEYLGAADYMDLYNLALAEDGLTEKYSTEQIEQTRNGSDPVAYPDERYYTDRYMKNSSNYLNLLTEASGGNEKAQYYANLGWNRNTGLLKVGRGAEEQQNRINMRGNVDFDINKWMKMHADGIAMIHMTREARTNNPDGGHPFWNYAGEFHPNWYPSLIPYDRVIDPDSAIARSATFVDGDKLLGGTSVYDQNIYGDLTRAGYTNSMVRTMQFNTGLDLDLSFITEGLSARGYLTFDLYNVFNTIQQNDYAIYQPAITGTAPPDITLTRFNEDVRSGTQNVVNPDFFRRVGMYGVVDYTKRVNDHDINISAVAYRDQIHYEDALQATKHLHFGGRASYAYKSKYLAELSGVAAGSPRFAEGSRFGFAPAVALGWVISEEGFLANSSVVDFLKLRGSWGIINTDEGFAEYYLYQTTYTQGGWFNYNNTVNRNRRRYYGTIGNPDISWIKREEVDIGIEALLLGGLKLEGGFFYSKLYDDITQRENYYTDFLDEFLPYENYNAYLDQGIEFGASYTINLSDLHITLGTAGIYATNEVLQLDEPTYDVEYRQQVGRPSDAIYGWVDDGLYSADDFADVDAGILAEGQSVPTFGAVQPGDIKYRDLNDDGIIDDNDQEMIGVNSPKFQYSLNLHLRYKFLELYALGTGQTGDYNNSNNAYYWVYGDRKYSEVVWNSWTVMDDKSAATYPRLTSRSNSNNFRTSTYWLEENNWFSLHTVQLSVNMSQRLADRTFFKGLQVYARGSNLLMISKIREKKQLNIGAPPQMRYYSIGLTARF